MKMKTTLTVLLILELYGLSSGLFRQHFFVNQEMTWISAQQHCRTFFDDLSTFTNESEQQHFLENAAGETDAWVGLYKESGVWKWSGGNNATNISWDTTDTQLENDDCAFLYKEHKKLMAINCTEKYAFFCMTISKFVLVQKKESWEGALEYCRNKYNDLASLISRNMTDSALKPTKQARTDYVWTGLRFLAGDWLWVNGDNLDFTNWSESGQPQCPARNLRCGAMDKQTGVWTNRDCEEKLNFICQ